MDETLAEKVGITILLLVCIAALFAVLHLDAVHHYTDVPMVAAVELKNGGETND